MNLKILHCNENYAFTGENYIFDQVNSSNSGGFLISEKSGYSSYNPVKKENRIIFRRRFKNNLIERVALWLSRNFFEKLYLSYMTNFFEKKLLKIKFDLMHAHFGHIAYLYLMLAKKMNLPMVVTFYGVDASACVKDRYWSIRLKKVFDYSSLIIVLCNEARQSLISIGCPFEKIRIWDIGIPLGKYLYTQPRSNIYNDTKFIMVARFVEKKGYFFLLYAFSKLVSKYTGISLTIIGHGPLEREIQGKLRELAIEKYVKIINTSKVIDFFDVFKANLLSHDVFVLPSIIAKNGDDEGGVPIVIINAMSMGLPVISTNIGGISRAIVDGETGFIVRDKNCNDLYKKMKQMILSSDELLNISKNARMVVESNFDKNKQLTKLAGYYAILARGNS